MNAEVAETSSKALQDDLYETKSKLSRVTAQQARAIGLDTRLSAALQEKDDLRQERDHALHRSKLAEARIAGLKERCCEWEYQTIGYCDNDNTEHHLLAKLQAQVQRLGQELDARRKLRQELSQDVLQDARERIHRMQASVRNRCRSEDLLLTLI